MEKKVQSKSERAPPKRQSKNAEEKKVSINSALPINKPQFAKKNLQKKVFRQIKEESDSDDGIKTVTTNAEDFKESQSEIMTEEPFVLTVKNAETETGLPPSIKISMKFATNYLQLNSTVTQEIPCSIELEGFDAKANNRSGIDIVCVIDVSGSMSGLKLELVKKTLLFMISKLDEIDRVSIITFSDSSILLSNFVCMNSIGKEKLSYIVKGMQIQGGTEIILGLKKSLKLLKDRVYINQVTSILLLTDGVDNNRDTAMSRLEKVFVTYDKLIATSYTIHAFGYGQDHQADLLNLMSQRKNGGFYYVETENSIPQLFSDCLGEMMSIVADGIFVEVSTQPAGIQYSLIKVYSETGDTSFRMPSVLAGDKKETMFLLSFPPTSDVVPNGHKEYPVKAVISYTLTSTGQRFTEEAVLEISVINQDVDMIEIEINEDVMVNFHRAKAAESLREAAAFGDKGDMVNARRILSTQLGELRNSKFSSHKTVENLVNDIDKAIPKFRDVATYDHVGKADLKSKYNSHQNKRNNYKNVMQKKLTREAEDEI
jgi:uncharacterized protein YegL